MKKEFLLEDLECANCAAKMEHAIAKLKGVSSASVSFLTQKLIIEAQEEDFARIVVEAGKLIKKIEPDCRLIVR